MRKYYTLDSHNNLTPILPISTFAFLTGISLPTARDCCERAGEKRRPVSHFKDGASIWVAEKEVEGYPFVRGVNVYHCQHGQRVFCPDCTYTSTPCSKNLEAQIEF